MIDYLNNKIQGKTTEEQLQILADEFKGKIVFSTSFGQEDQVITDLIFRNKIDIQLFTLDTGRLFEETYKVLQRTRQKYEQIIKVYFPEFKEVEQLVSEKGPYSFYESVENRKECCRIRKVVPLNKALAGNKCWITGLRAEQSEARKDLPLLSFDEQLDIIKYNPLKDWTLEEVTEYLKKHHVPYNPLHDKGFISIGCAPCTRAVNPGEDIRRGRWWWEDNTKKECGLHEHNIK
ncbi:MAG: phosphoadenylyl-sulfate reductase [Bacteroidales bacterium]